MVCASVAALCLLGLSLRASAAPVDVTTILIEDRPYEDFLNSRSTGTLRRQLAELAGAPVPSSAMPAGGVLPPDEVIPANGIEYLVPNTTMYPFSAIGWVIFETSTYSGLCSGSLIAPSVVLTAAHCVFDTMTGVEPIVGVFIPAYNPNAEVHSPFGQANITAFKFPSAFAECPLGNYSDCFALHDVALLYLDQSFENTLEFGYDNALQGNETLYTAGYPGDRCNQTSEVCYMWAAGCPMTPYNDTIDPSFEECMSSEGQSGSPIWLDDPSTGEPLVIGILTFGPGGPGSNETDYSDYDYTGFTVITAELMTELQTWVSDGPDSNNPSRTGALLDQIPTL